MQTPSLAAEGREPSSTQLPRARLRPLAQGTHLLCPESSACLRGCSPKLPSGCTAPQRATRCHTEHWHSRGRAGLWHPKECPPLPGSRAGCGHPAARTRARGHSKRYLSSAESSCSVQPTAWKRSREGLEGMHEALEEEPSRMAQHRRPRQLSITGQRGGRSQAGAKRFWRGCPAASRVNGHQSGMKWMQTGTVRLQQKLFTASARASLEPAGHAGISSQEVGYKPGG